MRRDSPEEQQFKSEMAAAMSGPATVSFVSMRRGVSHVCALIFDELGVPARVLPVASGLGCQKDLESCPQGWRKKGVLCYAGGDYSGLDG